MDASADAGVGARAVVGAFDELEVGRDRPGPRARPVRRRHEGGKEEDGEKKRKRCWRHLRVDNE